MLRNKIEEFKDTRISRRGGGGKLKPHNRIIKIINFIHTWLHNVCTNDSTIEQRYKTISTDSLIIDTVISVDQIRVHYITNLTIVSFKNNLIIKIIYYFYSNDLYTSMYTVRYWKEVTWYGIGTRWILSPLQTLCWRTWHHALHSSIDGYTILG